MSMNFQENLNVRLHHKFLIRMISTWTEVKFLEFFILSEYAFMAELDSKSYQMGAVV